MAIVLNGTTGITNDGGYTGDGIVFADTTPANTLVTDTSGNVGVGTASPTTKLDVNGSIAGGSLNVFGTNTPANGINNVTTNALGFFTNSTERGRFDSSGNFLVGTTSVSGIGKVDRTSSFGIYTTYNVSTTPFGAIQFQSSGTEVGRITINSSSTSYVTSSDYRLKNTIAPMTGALATVALLKPCTYKWNVDSSNGQGFIAHELAEVVPECVTGEKDAVDENGNPQYQGIDTSFLVATLTAAIQELKAIVDAQSARITALEGTQA